jgi:hypothetical protein
MEDAALAAALADSVSGEQIPTLLAESSAVMAAVELGGHQWVLPSADGSNPEQAQVVWIAMDPYGDDYDVTSVMMALPGRGEPDAVLVSPSSAYAAGHPPVSVRFVHGTRPTLDALLPVDVSTAVEFGGQFLHTFDPASGGVVWPSPSALCRRAPPPLSRAEVFIQFSDLGPQFALQGDIITDGFITADDFDDLAGTENSDELPLLPVGERGPARGRGRGRGSRTRVPSAEGRSSRGRGRGASAPAGGGGPASPPRALIDEIRSAVRSEMTGLTMRIERLERASQSAPTPTMKPPGLDPLFGRVPDGSTDVLAAAREAQQLLRFGAGSPAGSNPFAMPMQSGPKAASKAPPAKSGPLGGGVARVTPLHASPASKCHDASGRPGPSTNELLSRIATALEASHTGGGAASVPDTGAGSAASLSEYLNLLSGAGTPGDSGGSGSVGGASRAGGLWALERIKRTRRERPELVLEAAESIAKEQLGVLSGESWNWRRHAESELLPHCGNFSTLKRMIVLIAACLDEGRVYGPQQQHALLQHAYKVLEATAKDPSHEMQWSWPLLGIADPAGRKRSNFAPGEAAALVAFHRDEAALEESKKKLSGSGSHHAEASPSGGDDSSTPWWRKSAAAKAAAKAVAKAKAAASPGASAKPAGQPAAGQSG